MGLGGIGIEKLLLLFVVVLLLFGARRIPEIAGSMGKGIREFKKSVRELKSDTTEESTHAGTESPREVKRLM